MTFSQLKLNPEISKALHACGYDKPTPIQEKSIPDIILGKDLVASAQTGTGKTAAFVLPLLHKLSSKKSAGHARVLILTPTRELASQITQAIHKYGKFLRLNIISLVGGTAYGRQLKGLARALDIIVATPGRLLDHMKRGRVVLSKVEMLILDEADRMLDMGFIDDVTEIANATPPTRQTLLFSATVDNRLNKTINQLLKNPVHVNLSQEKLSPALIAQEIYMADNPQHKIRLLNHFLTNENIFKAIIFSGTKINADKLANEFRAKGLAAAPLHGDLKQAIRNKTIDSFRSDKIQFLIATDVAARGIDIQDVTHVINFDLPKFSEDYVHRIGRTGRAGKDGIAISLVLTNELRHLQRIERYIKQTLPRKIIAGLEPEARSHNSFKNKKKKKKSFSARPSNFKKPGAKKGSEKKKFFQKKGKR